MTTNEITIDCDKLVACRGDKSRQKVSDDIGITPQMLGMIERGDRRPSLVLAKKISDYYGLPLDDIFLDKTETKRFYK